MKTQKLQFAVLKSIINKLNDSRYATSLLKKKRRKKNGGETKKKRKGGNS